jgi:hypothetical protein
MEFFEIVINAQRLSQHVVSNDKNSNKIKC